MQDQGVLVMGGARGIGAGIASTFAEAGAQETMADINVGGAGSAMRLAHLRHTHKTAKASRVARAYGRNNPIESTTQRRRRTAEMY